jgi:hypothetical protein
MALNTRNEPDPDVPYASCESCGTELPTQRAAREHLDSTGGPAADEPGIISREHRIRITNPSRAERAASQVEQIISEAVHLAIPVEVLVRSLQEAVDRGDLAYSEVTDALRHRPEFCEAWRVTLPEGVDIPDNQPALFDSDLLDG